MPYRKIFTRVKGYVIPLHAMEALGVKGGIALFILNLGIRWG
jgi:hypothetical protein